MSLMIDTGKTCIVNSDDIVNYTQAHASYRALQVMGSPELPKNVLMVCSFLAAPKTESGLR